MDKRTYELTLVLPDDTTEKDSSVLIKDLLQKTGGEVVSSDFWGKKDLMYSIKKQNKGNYSHFVLSLAPASAVDLAARLKNSEQLLRHLLVIKNSIKEAKKKTEGKK